MGDGRRFRAWPSAAILPRLRVAAGLIFAGCIAAELTVGPARAVDVTFNIEFVAQSTPFPPLQPSNYFYAEVWAEGDYAYVGSDRVGWGMSIFDISEPANPQFLTMYPGTRLQDVKVHDGIGYFSSEGQTGAPGTGVDILDLSNPASPVLLSRIESAIGGHQAVHTIFVSEGYLYTADNRTDVVKVFDVANPQQPQFVQDIVLPGMTGPEAAHQITVLDGRLYVSSKWNQSNTCCGWTHIYDVSEIGTTGALLLKVFESGPRTHSSWPTEDGNILVVAEERPNGEVHIFDISMINEPNDPDDPILLKTLNRTNVGIDAHSPHNPLIRGNLLFLSWYEAGIQVFNIADPANPVHVGAFDTHPGPADNIYSGAWGVFPFLGLDRVLIGDRQRGLIIVDATGVLAPGDYTQLGIVDEADYELWKASFGSLATPAADGSRNGIIDAADYTVWRDHLGQMLPPALNATASAARVPEPANWLPAVVAAMFFGRNRRRWPRPHNDRR